MSKTLFKSIKEMKEEDRKKLFRTVFFVVSLAVFVCGFGLVMYSCKSEVPSYDTYKAQTDWESVLDNSTWLKQSCHIPSLDAVKKIRFSMSGEKAWNVRFESSDSMSDEFSATIENDSGTINTASGGIGIHLSESQGYWLRLSSSSGEVADFILEN